MPRCGVTVRGAAGGIGRPAFRIQIPNSALSLSDPMPAEKKNQDIRLKYLNSLLTLIHFDSLCSHWPSAICNRPSRTVHSVFPRTPPDPIPDSAVRIGLRRAGLLGASELRGDNRSVRFRPFASSATSPLQPFHSATLQLCPNVKEQFHPFRRPELWDLATQFLDPLLFCDFVNIKSENRLIKSLVAQKH
jgi:hypothetical protein